MCEDVSFLEYIPQNDSAESVAQVAAWLLTIQSKLLGVILCHDVVQVKMGIGDALRLPP
jgi:hypothetical protein